MATLTYVPDGTPSDEYPDVPAAPGEPGYLAAPDPNDPDEPTPTDDGPKYPDPDGREQNRLSALYLLSRGIDACTVCGGAHRPTQCPDVRQAREDMEYADRLANTPTVRKAIAMNRTALGRARLRAMARQIDPVCGF